MEWTNRPKIVLLPSLYVTLQNKFHFNASQNDEIDRTRCFMKQVVRFLPSTRVPSWGETFCSVPVGEKPFLQSQLGRNLLFSSVWGETFCSVPVGDFIWLNSLKLLKRLSCNNDKSIQIIWSSNYSSLAKFWRITKLPFQPHVLNKYGKYGTSYLKLTL